MLLKNTGVLLKDPRVLLKESGVLFKHPGVLLKDPGVSDLLDFLTKHLPARQKAWVHDGPDGCTMGHGPRSRPLSIIFSYGLGQSSNTSSRIYLEAKAEERSIWQCPRPRGSTPQGSSSEHTFVLLCFGRSWNVTYLESFIPSAAEQSKTKVCSDELLCGVEPDAEGIAKLTLQLELPNREPMSLHNPRKYPMS